MKLTLERTALHGALSRVANIVDSRASIPILANVILTAAGDTLVIRASNGDMEAVEAISANVEADGSATASAAKLTALVASLANGAQVNITLGDRLSVSSGRARINLATLPADMFPALWEDEWPTEIEINAGKLARLLDATGFAQGVDASRAYIQGVRFDHFEGHLRAVATNSAMLVYLDGVDMEAFTPITIPTRMVGEMQRLLSQAAGDVSLSLSATKLRLQVGGVQITSKLLDPSLGYPDYMRVVPSDDAAPNVARVSVSALAAAIRRTSIASQNAKDNTVYLTFKTGGLGIGARNAEADALDEIDAEYEGDEVTVALHPGYLLDVIEHAGSEIVEVKFGGNRDATTWRAADADGALAVMMPQRVGG